MKSICFRLVWCFLMIIKMNARDIPWMGINMSSNLTAGNNILVRIGRHRVILTRRSNKVSVLNLKYAEVWELHFVSRCTVHNEALRETSVVYNKLNCYSQWAIVQETTDYEWSAKWRGKPQLSVDFLLFPTFS